MDKMVRRGESYRAFVVPYRSSLHQARVIRDTVPMSVTRKKKVIKKQRRRKEKELVDSDIARAEFESSPNRQLGASCAECEIKTGVHSIDIYKRSPATKKDTRCCKR
jgi:hypothetical protein